MQIKNFFRSSYRNDIEAKKNHEQVGKLGRKLLFEIWFGYFLLFGITESKGFQTLQNC